MFIKNERLKSYILLFLILLSVIQVGILWSYQTHGFPISFFTEIFSRASSAASDSQAVNAEFLKPYRIIACNGGTDHWLLDRNDAYYTRIWDEAQECLKIALSQKQHNVEPSGNWGEVIARKGFVFEFRSNIPSALLQWFFKQKDISSGAPSGVFKMALLPSEDINNNSALLYLLDDKGSKLFKYEIPYSAKAVSSTDYAEILDNFEKDAGYKSRSYMITRDLYGRNSRSKINPDILVVAASPMERKLGTLRFTVPETISRREEMERIIPEDEKNYSSSEDSQNALVLWNSDNTYILHQNGLLEYKYMANYSGTTDDDIGAAFTNACNFISRIRNAVQLHNVEIYLSGMERSSDGKSFNFKFDYLVDGIPVYYDYLSSNPDRGKITHAILINSTSSRILSAQWLLRDIAPGDGTYTYRMKTEEVLSASSLKYDQFFIVDMGVGYVFKEDDKEDLEPNWVIATAGEGNYFVALKQAEGE